MGVPAVVQGRDGPHPARILAEDTSERRRAASTSGAPRRTRRRRGRRSRQSALYQRVGGAPHTPRPSSLTPAVPPAR